MKQEKNADKASESSQLMSGLLPQPFRLEVQGHHLCQPSSIRILVTTDHPMVHLAAKELAEFFSDGCGQEISVDKPSKDDTFTIFIGTDELADFPLGKAQRYRIKSTLESLRLIGEAPVGAYYAVKTLKQAVSFHGGRIHIPLLEVSDGADLAERGFWDFFYPSPIRETFELHTFTTRQQWFTLIDDLGDYKINLMELLVTGEEGSVLCYNSARFPQLVSRGVPSDKNDLIRAVMAYARQRAVKIIPTICHPEHLRDILKLYPEIKAVNPTGCQPFLHDRLLCFSHPKTREVFTGIIEEIADIFEPPTLCLWLPENMGHCTCPKCRDWTGAARAYLSICEEAKARIRLKQPDFKMRYLVAFMQYSDRSLSLLPADAELEYHECTRHGPYGFSEKKQLPDRVAHFAKSGRCVVGCINYRGVGLKYVPLPFFDNVRGWIEALIRGGACGVSGSIYSNPGVYRWNLLCMADAAWNLTGHTSEEFVRAMVEREMGSNMTVAMREARVTILQALSRAWYLSHQLKRGLNDIHALTRIRDRRPMDYIDACYLTDALEECELPRLHECILELERAVQQATSLGDELLQNQTGVARAHLSYQFHVFSALHIYGRQMWPDPEKGPWTDWVEELVGHLRQAREHFGDLSDAVRRFPSRYLGVTVHPSTWEDAICKLLDGLLDPSFKDRLRDVAWPDVRCFL